ncbi:MAG: phage DNA encapsidation protein [Bacteroidales bacterium]|nr:phage DNA encapsidation protein [Candidatus Colicola equi]
MYKTDDDFIDFLPALSYNAIFNFFDTVRNTGKTTKAKAWVLARWLKKKKKCVWIRTFEDDIKECKHNFYTVHKSKPIKIVNELGYSCTASNIVQEGDYIYFVEYTEKGKIKSKDWFLHLISLSNAQSIKGNEIPNCDLIIYDEYRTKQERINRYTGNQAKDFIDIVMSISRDHYVRAILLGNKETYNNPMYEYLRIQPPSEDWEGIRTYNDGSILIQQINHVPKVIEDNAMNRKLKTALKNTPILGYLYDGKTEGIDRSQIAKMPGNVYYGCGFVINGSEFSVSYSFDGRAFFRSGLDNQQHVYSTSFSNKYKYCERLLRGDKQHFKMLLRLLKMNKVYFCDVSCYEYAQNLFKLLM